MLSIEQVDTLDGFVRADELEKEYLEWGNRQLEANYGIQLDIEAMQREAAERRSRFLPPHGRFLVAGVDGAAAGCIGLKRLGEETGEVKRLYVRPAHRGEGVGRALVERALNEARAIGYRRVRLDSAGFMQAAHALYRRAGFRDIEPYEQSEIPAEHHRFWVFMELALTPTP